MASGGLIGALRVTLGIDTSEFTAGTSQAQAEMRRFQREFDKAGKKWQKIGKDLTAGVTLPVVAAGAAVIKLAGDFESSMNKLQISSEASAEQIKAMREEALKIGADTTKSASEAAYAMDLLARTGMDAKDILEGGARAAVKLAEATGSELDPAASAISDTMKLWHKNASDLPNIINTITGAVNKSKFEFGDFQMGMSQAGGIAASMKIPFDDFATALAGTSSQFASGSDAGTSFKTFLTSMNPVSKQAKKAMEDYNLVFFDTKGNMKDLADISQMLQDKLGGLSTEKRTDVLKTIFGQDAFRTAIGMMELAGGKWEEMQAKIGATNAGDQAAARMKGFNGQLEQLKGSLETLAIRIADSGLLEVVTQIITAMSEWVDWMAKASPETLKVVTVVAALAAAMGPLSLVFGTSLRVVGTLLPLLARLGPLFTVLTTGIGYLTPVILALGRAMMTMMLNPVGLAITAVAALVLAWKKWDTIKPIIINLYNTVKEYVLNKLNAVWEGVKAKIQAVKDWFYGLYDAVVGHSYIPDMVDEIGQHMGRLDDNLVKPAKKGTDAAKQAFEQLQQSVRSILDRLFPEQARDNTLLREIDLLEQGMKKMGFTADQTAEAVRRLRNEYYTEKNGGKDPNAVPDWITNPPELVSDDKMKDSNRVELQKIADENSKMLDKVLGDTKEKTAQMAQKWAEMARDAVSSMRGMVNSFKSGDILGGIMSLLDVVGQVAGMFKGGTVKTATPTYNRSGTMGFSTGGSFKVGGSGGVDSQMMRFRASPGEIIDVRRGDQGRREPVIVKVVANDYFDARVDSRATPIAQSYGMRGAVAGANGALDTMKKQRKASLA